MTPSTNSAPQPHVSIVIPVYRAEASLEELTSRLMAVIEDTEATTAAATLGAIATWPEVLNVSLVYEYSGPDSPAPDDVEGFRDWRRSLAPNNPESS